MLRCIRADWPLFRQGGRFDRAHSNLANGGESPAIHGVTPLATRIR